MPALVAASALRSEHELAAHSYRHQRLEDHLRYGLWAIAAKRPRPNF